MADQYRKIPTLQDHTALKVIQLLGDYYSIKRIATGLTKATRILLRDGSIYYQNRDGSAHRSYKLTKGKGHPINDPNMDYFNETCLFDSTPVSYTNVQFLKFKNTVIKTPSFTLHIKYKVAHHLEKKVFFITSPYDLTVFAGPLYCADVSSSATEVVATLGYDFIIKDIAIDQYTGDIFLLEYNGEIKCLKKKSHYAEVDTLISEYLYGDVGATSNANNEDVEDIIYIE